MPNISELFQRIDGYDFASTLDLYMGFHHITLSEYASNVFTTVLPWGKHSYTRMPLGYTGAPDVFQHRMDQILGDLPFCACFIDDIAIWTKGSLELHLQQLSTVLDRLVAANARLNLLKCIFLTKKLKYLGCIFTKKGIRADQMKVGAISRIVPPSTKKQLRGFLGKANYLCQHIPRYSHHSAVLTDLLKGGKTTKLVWTERQQTAFEEIKALLARSVLLSFPDYKREFYIYTDASNYQMGSVILQEKDDGTWSGPIAYFSKKLPDAQRKYTVMEQELLSIVKTLKTFRTMLLGQVIIIYTDHKNLTFDKFASDRVARWRLYVEEYGPELRYVPGENNVIADALSRLPMCAELLTPPSVLEESLPELMDLHLPSLDEQCPIHYRVITDQQQAKIPRKIYQKSRSIRIGSVTLKINCNERVMIPESLRQLLMNFYQDSLQHPGVVRMTNSLWTNFAWPTLKEDVTEFVKSYDECPRFKKSRKHYGHLKLSDSHTNIPWDQVAVDCTGPWTIHFKKESVKLTSTRWLELVRIHEKTAKNTALLFDRSWLCRYPRPTVVIHDAGTEFGQEFGDLLSSYGIQEVTTTVKNPHALNYP
jgi:hypothetical protein